MHKILDKQWDPELFWADVTIYGAGVAGLTAAHELAERGFHVRVVERARACDQHGVPSMAIGGMARTQYALAERKTGGWWEKNQGRSFVDWLAEDAKSDLGELSRELSETVRIEFKPRADTLAPAHARHLRKALARFATKNVRVVGYADRFQDYASDAENAALSDRRAQAVANALESGLAARQPTRRKGARPRSQNDYTIRIMPGGARGTRPVAERKPPGAHYRYVVVGVDRDILPGEHGFRFFPSYYRHVFDTMQRIPLLNAAGNPTGQTVYNNIVPSTFQGLSAGGANPFLFPRVPTNSAIAALDEVKNLQALGYSPADLQQFVGRILQFLTSCTLRRQQEYEQVSWWDFLMGKSRADRVPACRYTQAFADDAKNSGRVLAAFDAIWGDARTCGDTFVQLLLNNVSDLPKTDGTLCGPTTEAWLAPWRRDLETLGVQFDQAELLGFEQDASGRLVVRERRFNDTTDEWDADETRIGPTDKDEGYPQYFIVALDAPAAAKATDALERVGVLKNLRNFVHIVPGNPDDQRMALRVEIERDPYTRLGERPWDRFQTLSGVQYFFTADFCLSEGYMYYEDTDWALSSINSQRLWRRRPRYNTDGYISLMSVDIGNFLKPSPQLHRSAWNASRSEIARETWRQIQTSLVGFAPITRDRHYDLPQPTYFHLDQNLRFAEGRIIRNDTPYLIPVRGDWQRRPAADPWDPTPRVGDTRPAVEPPTDRDVWQAEHGGYLVHWGCLVFAGVYMKTFTRMTTMEAANESARHAVNAVLDHYYDKLKRGARGTPPAPEGVGVGVRQGRAVGAPTDFGCEALFHPLPIGDYCRIWDPEKNELDAAIPLRILDEDLLARGLPHLLDPAWAAVLAADPIGTQVKLAEITTRLLTDEQRERLRLLWSYVAPWLSPTHEFAGGIADGWARLWKTLGHSDPLQRMREFLEVLRQIRADLKRT